MIQDKNFHLIQHAIISDRLGKMREKNCQPQAFRTAMKEIAIILAIEASRNLPTHPVHIETPLETTDAERLSQEKEPLIVPILRAGLGISQGFETILPECDTGHIGLYRDEITHKPETYLIKLPQHLERPTFVCDPMLATGHSMVRALDILVERGGRPKDIAAVTLLCVPEGLETLRTHYPDLPVFTAALDHHLNEHAYIVPGLGDAGDRIFGTV